jgi:hypothetical protein
MAHSEGGGSVNASDRFQLQFDRTAEKLRAWQDQHLSVEASFAEATEPKGSELRLVTSFPRAKQEFRGLVLRRGLGGARRS